MDFSNLLGLLDERAFYGNSLKAWVIALLIGVLAYSILNIIRNVVANRLQILAEKTVTDLDDFAVELIRSIKPFLMATVAVYAATYALDLPPRIDKLVETLAILAFFLQCAFWANRVVEYLLQRYVKSRPTEEEQLSSKTMLGPLKFIGFFVVWSLFFLLALDNMGFDVTALVAGLGVGGIAVALAVQNILGDLFAAMTIVIDKPFVVGDFIIVGDLMGNVEHIGLKTTRLRSLSGEQLIFSNSDLLSSRVRNFKRMYERRIVFNFGVIYQTPYDKLAAISGMIREIIEKQELARPDRIHFLRYGNSSLDFEAVYYVTVPDFNSYADTQQAINLEMFKRFAEEGIEFAYPTQTLFVTHENTAVPNLNELVEAKSRN